MTGNDTGRRPGRDGRRAARLAGHLVARGPWWACGGTVEVDSFTAGRPPAA